MSLKNKLPQKRVRKAKRLAHAESMELLGNVRKSMWLKMKNKYGNFIYKLLK